MQSCIKQKNVKLITGLLLRNFLWRGLHRTWSPTTRQPVHFPSTVYEGWNFNSGNYLFTTDTK